MVQNKSKSIGQNTFLVLLFWTLACVHSFKEKKKKEIHTYTEVLMLKIKWSRLRTTDMRIKALIRNLGIRGVWIKLVYNGVLWNRNWCIDQSNQSLAILSTDLSPIPGKVEKLEHLGNFRGFLGLIALTRSFPLPFYFFHLTNNLFFVSLHLSFFLSLPHRILGSFAIALPTVQNYIMLRREMRIILWLMTCHSSQLRDPCLHFQFTFL